MGPQRRRHLEVLRAEAWVGDAVLALYVREMLLKEGERIDGELFTQLTSNKFLQLLGNATEIEAAIGRAYRDGQLALAYAWIDRELFPKMKQQMAERRNTRDEVRRTKYAKPGNGRCGGQSVPL